MITKLTSLAIASAIPLLSNAHAATVTWGGAGSQATPISWDSANNSDSDHWNQATAPVTTGGSGDSVILNGGGLQKTNGLVFADGNNLAMNGGYLSVSGGNFGAVVGSTISISNATVAATAIILNRAGTITVGSSGTLSSSTNININNFGTPGGTVFLDGGTLIASGAESNPLRAGAGLNGGSFDFTALGGAIQFDNFTGGDLTAYLDGKATTSFFKIDGTLVSGFGETNSVGGQYIQLTDNGTSGSLVLVPEPSSALLCSLAGVLLLGYRRREVTTG